MDIGGFGFGNTNPNFPEVGVLIDSIMQDSTTYMSQVGGCAPSCPEKSLDVVTWETFLVKLSSLSEWEALGWDREDGSIPCPGFFTHHSGPNTSGV